MPGARGVERRAMRHTDSNEAPKPNECVQGRRNGPNQEHAGRRKINMSKSPGCRSRAEIWRLIPPSGNHTMGRLCAAATLPRIRRRRGREKDSTRERPCRVDRRRRRKSRPRRPGPEKGVPARRPNYLSHIYLFYLSPSARSLNRRFVVV